MIKSFKEFWIEYWDLCKESMKWIKKHWIGYIILCIVIFAITFIPTYISMVKSEKELHDYLNKAYESRHEI